MAVVMTYGGTTFTASRDPAMGGFATVRQWRNPMIKSAGGVCFVYNKGITKDFVTLTWSVIDPTDLINLLAFLDAIDYSSNPFDFTDPAGVLFTAHFMGPASLKWTPVELLERDITIELLIMTYLHRLTDESGNYLTDESGNRLLVAETL
jgi:hypothetical protein